jgi:hypothetical protein
VERLYLTERQDIIGTHANRSAFADLLVGFGKDQPPESPFQQIGTWILIGMTGRWQRTIALWEWNTGWDGFATMIEKTMMATDPTLTTLYERVDALRSGGECYVMHPGPGCPERRDLVARGVTGSLLVYETVTVAPGTEDDYVELVRAEWQPVAEEHGYQLIGNYVAALVDGRVFTAWACERDQYVSLARSGRGRAWRHASAGRLTRSWQEEVWISAPGSPLAGPETAAAF